MCTVSNVNDSLGKMSNRNYGTGSISIKGATGSWKTRSFHGLDTVFLFFCFNNASSNITTADVLFAVSNDSKPNSNMQVPGFIITDNGIMVSTMFQITTDGDVKETTSGYCRSGYGFGFYTLS